MILLKEYIKNKISELEGTKVQEKKAKSKILIQHYLKISEAELFFKDIILSLKDKNNLKSFIGNFVEANIYFADEYDLYGEIIEIL